MPSSSQPLKINGVISTNKTALQNLNDLCTASSSFLTYDISQGKWAVIINTTGSSVKSYSDSNIIGNINVIETGVSELYNSCSLEFPHRTLKDQTEFVEVSIPSENRFPNEIENTLQIQSNLINDPIQAQYIASVELKQSRLNKIINFSTDYTSLGIKAGDLIDVTSSMYGYSSKVFRVTKLEEADEDVIAINITALEYSADVYSTAGLTFVEKTKKTGIMLKQKNDTIQAKEDANIAGSLARMLAANAGLGIVNSLLNKLFGRQQIGTDANGNPIFSNKTKPTNTAAEELDLVLGGAKKPALSTITAASTLCEGSVKTITVGHTCSVCLFDIPPLNYPYTITGISAGDITIPLTGNVLVTGGTGALTFTAVSDGSVESGETATITIGNLSTTVTIYDAADFTLVATRNNASITEGGSVIVTLTGTGSKATGTFPYVISGTATGKVSSPALTGNVTLAGGTATLTIATTDDGVYQGTQGLTVTFGTAGSNPCVNGSTSTSITVLDNDTQPLAAGTIISQSCIPGTFTLRIVRADGSGGSYNDDIVNSTECGYVPPPPDVTRQYVLTPVVWEGVYDGTTGQLKSIVVAQSAYMPLPLGSEATVNVPLTLSVSQGNPSSITIQTTRAISTTVLGGTLLEPIISFNTVAPLSAITGSKTQVWGYY